MGREVRKDFHYKMEAMHCSQPSQGQPHVSHQGKQNVHLLDDLSHHQVAFPTLLISNSSTGNKDNCQYPQQQSAQFAQGSQGVSPVAEAKRILSTLLGLHLMMLERIFKSNRVALSSTR